MINQWTDSQIIVPETRNDHHWRFCQIKSSETRNSFKSDNLEQNNQKFISQFALLNKSDTQNLENDKKYPLQSENWTENMSELKDFANCLKNLLNDAAQNQENPQNSNLSKNAPKNKISMNISKISRNQKIIKFHETNSQNSFKSQASFVDSHSIDESIDENEKKISCKRAVLSYNNLNLLNKGLKHLSVIVNGIVSKMVSITYKGVSDCILKETAILASLEFTDQQELYKAQQNIKRRVYDALNVMISAGVLHKQGKLVSVGNKANSIQLNKKRIEVNQRLSDTVSSKATENIRFARKKESIF